MSWGSSGLRSTDERLRASQYYNRSLIEACPTALLVVDSGGGVTDVNEAAVNILGRPRKELVGSPLDAHFSIPLEAAEAMRRVYQGNPPSRFGLFLNPGGSDEHVVFFKPSAFHEPEGGPRRLLVAGVG